MKKIFALLSMAIVTGCTINVNEANDDHEEHEEFCYERMLYYGDVMQEYPDKADEWKRKACVDEIAPGECAFYDSNAYITVEECREVYKK